MNIPYGLASFEQVRAEGFAYIDKTRFIERLESKVLGRLHLLFLRPRRSGKSLWLSVLEHYYDLGKQDQFDRLFGDLWIGQHPTPEKNRYLIFRMEFTQIDPKETLEAIQAQVLQLLQEAARYFCWSYQVQVPELLKLESRLKEFYSPALLLSALLKAVQRSPYRVYALIDEYDNFTNALMSLGQHELYRTITHESGFLREFYKALKEGTSTGVVARSFVTGISPVTMDDVTSGANIFSQVSLDQDLNTMTGFTHAETRALLTQHMKDIGMTLEPEVLFQELIGLYNGYRFSRRSAERVFNPDMVLHFLSHLTPPDLRPEVLIDHNVRMDLSRLKSLLYEGNKLRPDAVQVVTSILEKHATKGTPLLTFPLEDLFKNEHFVSLLYYMGMLSLPADPDIQDTLVIPNFVAKSLYWESLHTLLTQETHVSKSQTLESECITLANTGEIEALLEYVYPLLVQMLSNRDLIQLSEKNVKFLLLPFLVLSNVFLPWSEVEANHGYADLLLIQPPAIRQPRFSILLELKYVKLTVETVRYDKEGVKHKSVKPVTKRARAQAVEEKFAEGEAQIARYLSDPRIQALGGAKGWKSFTLVFEGLESLHFRAPGGMKRKLLAPS